MDAPVAESRLPVGSSASTSGGRPAIARAIATRCRSPPGQLGRPGGGPVPEPDPVQRGGGQPPPLGAADPGVEQPVGDVAEHGLVLGEEELLEHEPDPRGPQRRQLPVGHPGRVEAGDPDRPAGRLVQGAHQVQQRGLARPGRADDRGQFPGRHRQAHPVERPHRRLPRVHLRHLLQFKHRLRPARSRGPGPAASAVTTPAPRRAGRGSAPRSPAPGRRRRRRSARPSPAPSAACSPADDLDVVPAGGLGHQRRHRHREHRARAACGGDVHRHRRLVQGPGRLRVGQRHLHRDRRGRALPLLTRTWWSPPCRPRTPRPAWSSRPAASRVTASPALTSTAGRRPAGSSPRAGPTSPPAPGRPPGRPGCPVTWLTRSASGSNTTCPSDSDPGGLETPRCSSSRCTAVAPSPRSSSPSRARRRPPGRRSRGRTRSWLSWDTSAPVIALVQGPPVRHAAVQQHHRAAVAGLVQRLPLADHLPGRRQPGQRPAALPGHRVGPGVPERRGHRRGRRQVLPGHRLPSPARAPLLPGSGRGGRGEHPGPPRRHRPGRHHDHEPSGDPAATAARSLPPRHEDPPVCLFGTSFTRSSPPTAAASPRAARAGMRGPWRESAASCGLKPSWLTLITNSTCPLVAMGSGKRRQPVGAHALGELQVVGQLLLLLGGGRRLVRPQASGRHCLAVLEPGIADADVLPRARCFCSLPAAVGVGVVRYPVGAHALGVGDRLTASRPTPALGGCRTRG